MKVNFQKYDYFYNGWIARRDKKTGQSELFVNGKWQPTRFAHDLNAMSDTGITDVIKLDVNASNFLQEQLARKIQDGKTL